MIARINCIMVTLLINRFNQDILIEQLCSFKNVSTYIRKTTLYIVQIDE